MHNIKKTYRISSSHPHNQAGSEVVNILKATVASICEENAYLLTAEIALKFMVQKLSNCESQINIDLVESLKTRISQRRVPGLSGTIKYLHDRKSFYDEAGVKTP